MKKFFTYLLAFAAVTTVISCSKDDVEPMMGFSNKMTINGQTEEVKSAFYGEYPVIQDDEAGVELYLFKDAFTECPEDDVLSFAIYLDVSESLFGKTIDLSKPITKGSKLEPYLYMAALNIKGFDIEYYDDFMMLPMKNTTTSPLKPVA